nr:tyrosine-type recombinase/integrase [Roseicella aerolata]
MAARGVVPDGANPWPRQAPNKPRDAAPGEDETARPFTDDEIRALLAGTQDQAMLDLMRLSALSGMRIEEACLLTVSRCAGGIFDVPGTKTAAAVRKVPIHPDLAELVERRCKGKDGSAWLLHELGEPDRYGRRSPTINARFNRYRVTVGVHERAEGQRRSSVTFHSWRRWFITEAIRAGQPERVVRQIVGHKQDKRDVTLGVYFAGDTLETLRACVEAVRLPKLLPAQASAEAA